MKKEHKPQKKKQKKIKNLEEAYREYLVPMSKNEWKNVRSLEQPTLLKQVSTKTAYSSGD
jgi:hypothetical protein